MALCIPKTLWFWVFIWCPLILGSNPLKNLWCVRGEKSHFSKAQKTRWSVKRSENNLATVGKTPSRLGLPWDGEKKQDSLKRWRAETSSQLWDYRGFQNGGWTRVQHHKKCLQFMVLFPLKIQPPYQRRVDSILELLTQWVETHQQSNLPSYKLIW